MPFKGLGELSQNEVFNVGLNPKGQVSVPMKERDLDMGTGRHRRWLSKDQGGPLDAGPSLAAVESASLPSALL